MADPSQSYITLAGLPSAELAALEAELKGLGFVAHVSPRAIPSLSVLVRDGTSDQAEVEKVALRRGARSGPPGTPIHHIRGYRAGL